MWVCIILVYVCMYVYTCRSVICSLFIMKTLTTLSFWRTEQIWILRVGKIINIFSFMRVRRRNFYFFFIRISVVVWINFPFLPFPQTCAHSVLLGSSRFLMLSVDAACSFAFSLFALQKLRQLMEIKVIVYSVLEIKVIAC